jgi:DNA-binding transcriptional LysR family regulator
MALRKEGDALQGRLRITSMRAFGYSVLVPLLAEFGRTHPGVAMELMFTERRVDLVREGVDVAFRITRKPPEDCVAQPVLRLSHWCLRQRAVAPGGSAGLAAMAFAHAGGRRAKLAAAVAQPQRPARETVELQPHISADSLEALVALARLGQGVVLAPDFCVQEDVAAGRLHNLLPDWHLPIAEGDCVQALTLPVHTAGANARALVHLVAQRLGM